jgi:hypothetical protein
MSRTSLRKSLSCSHRSARLRSQTLAMFNNISSAFPQRVNARGHRRLRFCSALAMVLVLTVSGVGLVVGGGVASASSKSSTKQPAKKSLKKFDTCLKKHGVKISFPGTGGPPKGGAPSGTFPSGGGAPPSGGGAPSGFKGGAKTQKALKACSKFLPAGSQFGGAPGSGTGNTSTALASFRNCMTLHHVTLAEGAYGNTKKSSSVTATTSSSYKTAYSACSALLPTTAPKSG